MKKKENTDHMEEMSEGEIFINEFFYEHGINSEFNKRIDNLKGDTKAYRLADFYLPKYDLYVEFFGKWNLNDVQRERYREKKQIYENNSLACIYFYPENLGIFDYLFTYRAMKELKERGKRKELFRFRARIVRKKNRGVIFRLVFMPLLVLSVILTPGINPQYNSIIYIISIISIAFDFLTLYLDYRDLVNKKFH